MRFIGEEKDRKYVCIEGWITKGHGKPFQDFLTDKDFCRQSLLTLKSLKSFVSKSQFLLMRMIKEF